ncbi:MAG: hypothetical protein AB8C02_00255 [Halioglobus sp.]
MFSRVFSRINPSLKLLLFLALLFSIPVAAKTFAAHGILAAIGTGLLVALATTLGPISFAFDQIIEQNIAIATSVASNTQVALIFALGVLLVADWFRRYSGGAGQALPYLPVTCWALLGAYFCVLQVFSHTT